MQNIPRAMGVDVSHHKGLVDWGLVRASGIVFAFAKATEGTSFIDSEFYRNWFQARQSDIWRGAYHFYRPILDPRAQANHFISVVRPIFNPFDLPPVLDVENSPKYVREEFQKHSPAENARRIKIWLDTVEVAFGKTPIIYTNQDTWRTSLGDTQAFVRYPLWIANYGVSKPNLPAGNWGGRQWHFWQKTDRATVHGIGSGKPAVDLNEFSGSEVEFRRWQGWDNYPSRQIPALKNSQMFSAIQIASSILGHNFDKLLGRLNLDYLADARFSAFDYGGLAIDELQADEEIIDAMRSGVDLVLSSGDENLENAIYRLTNQQVINGFYAVAEQLGTSGWKLLSLAGLQSLVLKRSHMYVGASIELLPGLTTAQRRVLAAELGVGFGGELPSPDEVTYEGITNQMVINAVYGLAATQGRPGWELLSRSGLSGLIQNRQFAYQGPALDIVPNLSDLEKRFLANVLNVTLRQTQQSPTYPGVTNQDVINAAYSAGRILGLSGWSILEKCGLALLASSSEMRSAPYRDARIESLRGLAASEREKMREYLKV